MVSCAMKQVRTWCRRSASSPAVNGRRTATVMVEGGARNRFQLRSAALVSVITLCSIKMSYSRMQLRSSSVSTWKRLTEGKTM